MDPLAPPGARSPVTNSNISVTEPLPFLADAVRRVTSSVRDLEDTNDAESMFYFKIVV